AITGDTLTVPYRLEQIIGKGGMGMVHRAEQPQLFRNVAIKTLRNPDVLQHQQAFAAELQATIHLEHPGVIPVHDGGPGFMVMREVIGQTLAEHLNQRSDSDDGLADLVEVVVRIAECVGYAHSRGIIHRDLKPANIMIGPFGEVYVMDWGLALAHDRAAVDESIPCVASASNICAGSPQWLSPEAAAGDRHRIGPACDLFGIGAILYAILCQRAPYAGDTVDEVLVQARNGSYQMVTGTIATTHPELVLVQRRLMAMDPSSRGTIAACISDLRAWLSVSAARERAGALLSEAELIHQRSLTSAYIERAYPLLEHAVANCEQALLVLADHQRAQATLQTCCHRYAELALTVGDLALAETMLTRADSNDPALWRRLRTAQHRRERQQRATARARRLLIISAVAAPLLAIAITVIQFSAQAQQRHQDQRSAEAMLNAADGLSHQRQIGAGLRAASRHPDPAAVQPWLDRAWHSYLTWAIDHGRTGLARTLLPLATANGFSQASLIDNAISTHERNRESQQRATRAQAEHDLAALTPHVAMPATPQDADRATEIIHRLASDDSTLPLIDRWLGTLLTSNHSGRRALALAVIRRIHAGDNATMQRAFPRSLGLGISCNDDDMAAAEAADLLLGGSATTTFDGLALLANQAWRNPAPTRIYLGKLTAMHMRTSKRIFDELLAIPPRVPLSLLRSGLQRTLIRIARTIMRTPERVTALYRELGEGERSERDHQHKQLSQAWRRNDLDTLRPLAANLIADHHCLLAACSLADSLLEANHAAEAVALLNTISSEQPILAGAQALAALTCGDHQAAKAAFATFSATLASGSMHTYALAQRSLQAAAALGDADMVERIGTDFFTRRPDWPLFQLTIAYHLASCGAHQRSWVYCERALQQQPYNIQACIQATRIYLRAGRRADAQRCLEGFPGADHNQQLAAFSARLLAHDQGPQAGLNHLDPLLHAHTNANSLLTCALTLAQDTDHTGTALRLLRHQLK
ncbi:MAG: protein kinase domain-containing protein, partial [Planctomycetota bacterium]